MSQELKPCPWCEKQPLTHWEEGQRVGDEPKFCRCLTPRCPLLGKVFTVEDWGNRAALPPQAQGGETPDEAAKAWLRSYGGSIDSTALLLAFKAGLRAAPSAQGEGKPVAWRTYYGDKVTYSDGPEKPVSRSMEWEALYTHPAPVAPHGEPSADRSRIPEELSRGGLLRLLKLFEGGDVVRITTEDRAAIEVAYRFITGIAPSPVEFQKCPKCDRVMSFHVTQEQGLSDLQEWCCNNRECDRYGKMLPESGFVFESIYTAPERNPAPACKKCAHGLHADVCQCGCEYVIALRTARQRWGAEEK